MTHIANYLSYLPKSLSAFFGAIMAFVFTFSTLAAPAVRIEADLGVANVTAGDTSYSDSVSAGYDEVVKVQLWYHNMENADSGLVAEDLTVKFDVPSEQGSTQTITGTVGGSNTNTVTNTVSVDLGRDDAYLEYIPGTAKWRHNTGTNDNINYQTVGISDDVVTAGAGLNIEDAEPCFNFEATVTILLRVRVPSIQVEKSVALPGSDAGWGESVTVEPGDKVSFLFTLINNGNSQLNNVTVGDVFPDGLTYVNGTTRLTNGNHPDGIDISVDDIANGGLNLNAFAIGGYSYVTIEADVADADYFDCGVTKLINEAVAKSDKAVIRVDTAEVKVKNTCEEEPKFEYDCESLSLSIINQDERTVRAEAQISNSSNVSVVGTEIDFGDNTAVATTNPAEHTYAEDGEYNIVATVAFELDNESKEVKEATCASKVTFTTEVENCPIEGKAHLPVDDPNCKEDTPETPEEPEVLGEQLPNTGAGSLLVTLFGATTAAAGAYGFVQSKRTV